MTRTPHAILTDIEGTTSSIAFVHDVLFPYSRARLADYVRAHREALTDILDDVRAESGDAALDVDGCIDRLLDWHDEDRKIAPLKELQGRIWHEGFTAGAFTGHIYPDAVAGLRRWHAAGIALYIYSSGSVGAQKLLFGHSDAGNLLPLFSGHFDTGVGGKKEAASYVTIARAIGQAPDDILFLSDVEAELEAARASGFATILLARDGVPPTSDFPVATTFDSILPLEATA